MLRELLALMASGGMRTPEGLSHDLKLSRPEIDDMLVRLCSLGYLEELSASLVSSCGDDERKGKGCAGCSGCALGSGCFEASKSRIWSLSKKGRELLARPALD
jgi:hypothetical protein